MVMVASMDLAVESCRYLRGVGPVVAQKLEALGIMTIQDVLFHLPLRYEDRTQLIPFHRLYVGSTAFIEGEVVARHTPFGGKTRLLLTLSDGARFVMLRFFHAQAYSVGQRLRCFGDVRLGGQGIELAHPECEVVEKDTPLSPALTPVYPTTQGVHQKLLRRLTDAAINLLSQDILPDYIAMKSAHLSFSLSDALRFIHRPPKDADVNALMAGIHPAQIRLAFEELLAHRLAFLHKRVERAACVAPKIVINAEVAKQFQSQLSFALTNAQHRVLTEIFQDMSSEVPMVRLVQGDVGSGKTVVAALAAQQAILHGYQVAIMAPTALLADQHATQFAKWFAPFNVAVCLCVGGLPAATQRDVLSRIRSGQDMIVVGTHALFQEHVVFHHLGLVIIDEQHRFGVEQRLALRNKGQHVHQLMMTATPIPRTLAMTAYADMDLSMIDELPPGRQAIQTVLLPDHKRAQVVSRVLHAIQGGAQVYWVCTAIEENERETVRALEVVWESLSQALPEIAIAYVHGRMKSTEKDAVMSAFKERKIQLLLATTVIEVGMDVPNASVMIIENAERLGLAQLHQLRGRVGRGTQQSYCVLMFASPLSFHAKERLTILRDCQDGRIIAEKDLALRGPGEVLGTRQSGEMQFRIANLSRDQALMDDVVRASTLLSLSASRAIVKRWLGREMDYQQV